MSLSKKLADLIPLHHLLQNMNVRMNDGYGSKSQLLTELIREVDKELKATRVFRADLSMSVSEAGIWVIG